MASIKHLFHINASAQQVYEALTTINGLANWWTVQTTGKASALHDAVKFDFTGGNCTMKVIALQPGKFVEWECTQGWPDWIGTRISFQLEEKEGKSLVRFEHSNWKEANDFFAGCSFSWGRFMESLRQYCQTGRGEAFGSEGYRK